MVGKTNDASDTARMARILHEIAAELMEYTVIDGEQVTVEVAGVMAAAAADLLDMALRRKGGEPCDVS